MSRDQFAKGIALVMDELRGSDRRRVVLSARRMALGLIKGRQTPSAQAGRNRRGL